MIDRVINDIRLLSEKYPKKESALIPALMLAQKSNENYLTQDTLLQVADLVGVTPSRAFGVASYYTMFNINKKIGKYHLQVDTNIPATLMGAKKIYTYLEEKLGISKGETTPDGRFTLNVVEDLASCGTTPVVQVNDVYYESMTIEKVDSLIESLKGDIMPPKEVSYNWGSKCDVLFKRRGIKNSSSIKVYKKNGGYQALAKAKKMNSEEIITEVKESELGGRGGAGFPTGLKWGFVPKNSLKPVYLICNADEGEPGTFKDREIMEYDPHLLIEGIAISAHAIGSKFAFIYIRGEFEWIAKILEKAILEAKADKQIKDLEILVHRGAGSYVCGEETALIESLEGKRGFPRMKPPFPAIEGLYGCPTVVNNVETLSLIPFIVEKGAHEFKKYGSADGFGMKLFGISGAVNKPGVYECPMGIPFAELIEFAGGFKGKIKGVIVGGLSTPVLSAEDLIKGNGLKMNGKSCRNYGTALGSGGIMVIGEEFSIPEIALRTMEFYHHESCGQCTPCRIGSGMLVNILKKIVNGNGEKGDIDKALWFCNNIRGNTLCPTGEAYAFPVKMMIIKFRNEFEQLININ